MFNALSGLAAVAGGLFGHFALGTAEEIHPYVLMLSAASFIYIALADLVPDLHRESRRARSGWLRQFALMAVGIAVIAVLTRSLHAH
jgi:zinc and cadmium transporter